MKKIYYLMAAAMMTTGLVGCSDDTYNLEGEGRVTLRAVIDNDVKVVSRADVTSEYAENCMIWISSEKGLVRRYDKISDLPAEGIMLKSGNYVAEAWAGDSVPASFDTKFFKGYQQFTVTPGANDQVNLECRIANTLVSVNYTDAVKEVLSDVSMKVEFSQKGSLTFEGFDDARKGYFMMPSSTKDLNYQLTGKRADGTTYSRSGVIADVKPTTEYVLNVKYNPVDTEIGGGNLTIEISAQEVVTEDEIVITTAPRIQGYGFDINQAIRGESGTIGRRSVWIMASSALKSVELESDLLTPLVGGPDINLMTASESVLASLSGKVTKAYTYDSAQDVSQMKISFEEALLNSLADGEYSIDITAVDVNDNRSHATLNIVISAAPVVLEPMTAEQKMGVYTNRATITGTVVKAEGEPVGFEYRQLNQGEWAYVAPDASRAATTVTATLTGLKPGTTYEYRMVCGDFRSEAQTFTTEAAMQLPNGGFDTWTKPSKAWLPYESESNMWWDTGNHGSTTMNVNVTNPDDDRTGNGLHSVKMSSQFVGVGSIGKFAAGNIFLGKYLGTQGTDGVIGFGRPFTSRPVKIRGWYKYVPGTVQYENAGAPDIIKGQPDKGIIYMALLDETLEEYNGEKFPVVVKTKDKKFFDKNASQVIASGEMIFTQTVEQWTQFEITFDYKRFDVKPSYILFTAAASKGGDYFAGGNSTFWLDDIEVVYE